VKRWTCLWGVLLVGLVALSVMGEDPLPAYTPAEYGSAFACYPTCILPNYIVAEDFDQDGWPDLAVSCFATSDVWIYRNLGNPNPPGTTTPGAFAPRGLGQFGVGQGPVALAAGHVAPYDGFPDVAVLSQIVPGMSGVQPNANRVATLPLAGGPPLVKPVHFAAGDFDHTDLIFDFAVVDAPPPPTPSAINVYTDGAFLVALPAVPAPGVPNFIVAADFDRNGWDDIAVLATGTNQLLISYSNGVGVFGGWQPYALAFRPTAMDVGDFNADGFLDIVVVGNINSSGFATVLLNSVSPRTFIPQGILQTWGLETSFVEVFDADGNGRDDFVSANYGSHTLTVFLTYIRTVEKDDRNRRALPCLCDDQSKKDKIDFKGFKIELECGFYPTCLVGGDFDRNGKMDLAVTLYSATEEICPQNPSCIEVIFDVACGVQKGQALHRIDPAQEPQACESCKEGPCEGNTPPESDIQTEGDSKNP